MTKIKSYGIYLSASHDFQRPPLRDLSRAIKANINDAAVLLEYEPQ